MSDNNNPSKSQSVINNNSQQKIMKTIYPLFNNTYESFKKCANKKDNNLQIIKVMSQALKDSSKNFSTLKDLWKYSLFLVKPFDRCTTKGMETILLAMQEILINNLLPPETMQKMA